MAWAEFTLAFVTFFLSHSMPLRPAVKGALVRVAGPLGFSLGYSLLSLGVLVWLIAAAGRAPFVPLWDRAAWQTHPAVLLMLLACVVAALGVGRPNPFSFGGARNHLFDPGDPGIIRLVRHPVLAALGLWALAHLLANGDLAHVILFGVFGAFALLGRRLVTRRRRREMGAQWQLLSEQVQRQPIRAAFWPLQAATLGRMCLGVVLFAMLLWLHPRVIGVYPLGF